MDICGLKINYYIIFISFFLSVLLWVSLSLDQTFEVDRKIKVKFNINKPYAISGDVPLFVDVKLKAKGWSLVKHFKSPELEFNYDLSNAAGEKMIVNTTERLNLAFGNDQSISIIYAKPDSMQIKIERYEEKYVKVVPYTVIDCIDGYQTVGKPVLEPDSILVGGAASVIRTLYTFRTQRSEYKNVNTSINEMISLSDSLSNIVSFSKDKVRLMCKIEPTAEKIFSNIEINIKNVPTTIDVLLIPQMIDLQVKGGVEQLSKIEPTQLIAYISFNELYADTSGAVIPNLIYPEGVTVISVKPEKIQYVIKKKK